MFSLLTVPHKLYTMKQQAHDVAALQHMHQKIKKYSLLEKSSNTYIL